MASRPDATLEPRAPRSARVIAPRALPCQVSFLQQDKDYLSRQVADVNERAAATEARLAKKEGKNAELKAALSAAQEKLLAATSSQAEGYAIKLEVEMAKWEQQSARAVEAAAEGAGLQVRQHKEARELAEAEAEKWHVRYEEARKQSDEHLHRAAEGAATADVQIAQLRADIRMRDFEVHAPPRTRPLRRAPAGCTRVTDGSPPGAARPPAAPCPPARHAGPPPVQVERLTAQYEQCSAGSRRGEMASNAWREKLEVLKTEYYKLKAASAARIAQLETQNEALHEKLKAYEKLEEELDKTVLQATCVTRVTSATARPCCSPPA